MTLSFPYLPVVIGGTLKPIIPIVFINEENDNDFVAQGLFVDSGADYSMISPALANRLNIDYREKPPHEVSGIGGTPNAVLSEVTIILHRSAEAYKFRIPIDVLVEGSLPYPLLGRIPTFDLFDVTFRQRKERIEFINKGDLKRITIPSKLLADWQRIQY